MEIKEKNDYQWLWFDNRLLLEKIYIQYKKIFL